MRVVYGVCGEGFGHSSRAKVIVPFLKSRGHDVLVVTYGQAYGILKKEFDVLRIAGIHLAFEKGRVSLSGTFGNVVGSLAKNVLDWRRIKKRIEEFKPEVAISDMEPFVPILRRLYGLPLISFDNQHRLTHMDFNVPREYKRDFLLARESVKKVVGKADYFIFVSFIKEKVRKKNVYVVDPLLRKSVLKLKPRRKDFILVYQTKKDKNLLKKLERINEKFVVYGYDVSKERGNLSFKKAGEGFINDLTDCKGVIASAGFMAISEALYLKKPYYAIPLKGQFEQTFNALILKKKGYGDFSEEPSVENLERFLGDLEKYEKNLKDYKINSREALEVLGKVLEKLERKM